jgi:NTE family protein
MGAGGVLGGAWLAGALTAVRTVTGWDPASAHAMLGTSAGSVFAALLAGGVAASRLLPRTPAAGLPDDRWVLAELAAEDVYRLPRRLPGRGPGSLGLALRALRDGAALRAVCGLLPRGLVPTAAIEATVRRAVPSGWAPRPGCWIVACDYSTGERVVFGRRGSPRPSLARAVAASCAIPGFFSPVPVGQRLYVDGGLHSLSNLDLLAGSGLDLVLALNPMSGTPVRCGWNPVARITAAMRRWSGQQLSAEAEALRRAGTEVLVLEPTERDLEAIGDDLMDARRAALVAETAQETTAGRLREWADRLCWTGRGPTVDACACDAPRLRNAGAGAGRQGGVYERRKRRDG